jgi:hypothetical protein
MTFILVGASLILTLVALAHVKFADFSDPTRLLVSCLAYGFVPAAVGYAMAIVNRLAGRGRTHAEFIEDRNWGWTIFLLVLAAGQLVQSGKL